MRALAAGLLAALLAAACTPGANSTAANAAAARCDPAAFRAVQQARANRTEVTVCGTVVRVVRLRRSRTGTHRIFYVDVGGNDRVQIDANVDIMGNFPIRPGEPAVIRGEYYADPSGRDGIHWTHRTDRGGHPPGYVILGGVTYR